MYKIYKYTNVANGKVYVGQTSKSLEERAQTNGGNYKECRRFYAAIKKYGWDSFIPEIIEDNLSLEEANRLEKYYINLFNSTDDKYGYNLALGGDNKEMLPESKKIISEKAKERYTNKENNPMFGKKHSREAIAKMSAKKTGEANPMYGTTWTDKQRAAIRKGWTYEWTPERRELASKRQKEIAKNWSKRVLCVEDNLEFNSISSAANHYGVNKSTLSSHLHGAQKSCAGRHFKEIGIGV